MAAGTTELIELDHDGFRLGVLPGLGGSLTHLVWSPGGAPPAGFDLLRRADAAAIASGNPSRLASFVMVPFANRIAAGRIPYDDSAGQRKVVQVPINRPAQDAAIHGFGRLAAWDVLDRGARRIRLAQHFSEPGNPFEYEAEQQFSIISGTSGTSSSVECRVQVTNRGVAALPFGLGFHPWFDRTPAAMLGFSAACAFRMDDRDMPIEACPVSRVSGLEPHHGRDRFCIAGRTPFDTPIAGWNGSATLEWPERAIALDMQALGALELMHIFSPAAPDVFCVEPVSHMPDVVNRRQLARYGDMQLLAPGETLEGGMRLTPRRLA